jgi:hypothetical protein
MGSRFARAVLIWVMLGLGFFKIPRAVAQQPVVTTVCAMMRDPGAFAGRLVKVRATVRSGFESSTIVDANQPSCDAPWFVDAPNKESTVESESYNAELQRAQPVYLVEDENMKRFDDALRAVVYPRSNTTIFIGGNPKRYNVTATMTGRVDDAGEGGSGFGHLNGWRVRFVLISVEEVATEERSYDWAEFSPDPVRFPHGTIRGKLTDAEGKPIKSAWVGAIPAEGKVPISFPELLTKEDGSYSLDVEPGKYFVVVNRNHPAREDVPVLTTYFPSTEIEAEAKALNIPDHAELTAIDIRIHRILTPHFFKVQVLGTDGEPATGAYAYLTQTNRTGIVGPHGVTHTNSDGLANLLAFEGLDYFLWADLGSWPSKQCAPVANLDGSHSDAEPIVVRISLSQDACSKQEREARSAARATQNR